MADLETLALLAAAMNPQLRSDLDQADFHPRHHATIEALQDGKSAWSRKAVANWLATLGVTWEATKGGIGTAVIESLKAESRKRRAERFLATAQWKLRCPALGSQQWSDDQLKLATAVEQLMQGMGDAGTCATEGASA